MSGYVAGNAPFTEAKFLAITKSDSTVYNPPLTMIYVGGAGDVAVLGALDTAAVTFTAPPVGTVLRGAFKKVMATNTSATLLIGGY